MEKIRKVEKVRDKNERILIVDDDKNFLLLLQTYLQQQGYFVYSASDGIQALEILEEAEPDLIISDIMMPEMNGYLFLENLRKHSQSYWIPVVLITAKAQSTERIKALDLGACAYLVKPFELSELNAVVSSAIRTSRLLSQSQPRRIKTRLKAAMEVKLTQTELIVAKLVVQGLSNQEIAQELNISKRTTESHISHMLKKTELNNRTELSLWFLENDSGQSG
jgi:DNA-binding NarL/FixJ family response regulator